MRKTPPFMRSFHFVFIIALIISVLIRCGFAAGSAGAAPISADLTETFASLPLRAPLCRLENEAAAPPRFRKESSDYAKKARNPASFISLLLHHRFRRSSGPALEPCDRKTSVLGLNNVDFGDTINIGYNVTLQSSPFKKFFGRAMFSCRKHSAAEGAAVTTKEFAKLCGVKSGRCSFMMKRFAQACAHTAQRLP